MLFSRKWEKPTVEGFIAWLEMQPSHETYEWFDCNRCAIVRYLESVYGAPMPAGHYWHLAQTLGMEEVALELPHTFGAALERARAFSQ